MKTKSAMISILILMLFCLSACERSISSEADSGETNSLLQIRTRTVSATDEASISYPVQVYVFSGSKCVALQTISDESQTLSIPLTEGTYSVQAFGGTSAANYQMPSMQEATTNMEILLQSGKSHSDLMTAKSSVTLVDGGTNTLTLAMERKVMMMQNVTISNIPTSATAVSVTLSPIWEKLSGTELSGESGTATVALTKQDDGKTWKLASPLYLLPPSENPVTITVSIVNSEGTSSYTYSAAEQLMEGYKLNIEGTYTEAIGVTLAGTITGSVWKGEKTISFEFNESGSTDAGDGSTGSGDDAGNDGGEDGNNNLTGNVPTVGSTYQGCYVLSVSESDGESEVLLLSPNPQPMNFENGTSADAALTAINAAMPSSAVAGISGWRLMTVEEANIVLQHRTSIPDFDLSGRYLYTNAEGKLRVGTIKTSVSNGWTFKQGDILQPVAIVTIAES